MDRLFLVDAYALIYRCYYAFLGRPMKNGAGMNTSAIFGFTKFLQDILKRERPPYLGVAFDPAGGTFRHELFPAYKANRTAAPEDVHLAVPYIKRILEAMRIPVLEVAGYEADDVIGTLSGKAAAAGFDVYMVTPDKDYGQLVRPTVSIYKQRKGGEGVEIVGMEAIKGHYGFDDPRLVIDVLALWGDASDNIPGVPGIGEKNAIKLVNQFGPVEQILANADKLSGRQRENILASQEQLMLSKRLATIEMDVPIDFNPGELLLEQPDEEPLKEVYRELGFNMFIRELEGGVSASFAVAAPEQEEGDAPRQAKQTQLAKVAAEKSRLKMEAAMRGQGSLFDDRMEAVVPATPASAIPGDNGPAATGEPGAAPSGDGLETAATTPHAYHVVRTAAELRELAEKLRAEKEFCFDTETTGFDLFNDRIVGISFAVKPFEAWYVPCDPTNLPAYAEILRPLFGDEKIAKIGQNLKFDIMMLRNAGIEVRGFKYDTMILHYLLDPESRHGMNFLARTYLNYSPIEIETLIGRGAKQLTMDMVAVDRVAEYAAEDADVTLRLKEVLWPKVVGEGLAELYEKIEEPMIDVLAEIELTGVRIDTGILAQYGAELSGRLESLEERIRIAADEPSLNVNSSRQLGEALFAKLRIDPKPKMTKTKQFRTDEEYLQSLAGKNPIIGLILEYRGVKKLLSTYIEALPQLVNGKTGRAYLFQSGSDGDGPPGASNPNLQNIPVREEQGREIRKAFVPTSDDYLLLSCDYSQVELRLMAHLSGDPALIGAFRHEEDIHSATAAHIFRVPIAEVTAEQRRKAKTANFGIIYGISAFGLGQRLGIPRAEAREIIDGYFTSYGGVREYMEKVAEQAREKGYVSTIFGRKRFLNDIRSANAVARGLAERNAINAPIQGSAADIMKLAMIEVYHRFRARNLRSRVILQVHDELVVDMYKPEQEEVIAIVVEAMEGAAQLAVPLTVDYGIGTNWIEAH